MSKKDKRQLNKTYEKIWCILVRYRIFVTDRVKIENIIKQREKRIELEAKIEELDLQKPNLNFEIYTYRKNKLLKQLTKLLLKAEKK